MFAKAFVINLPFKSDRLSVFQSSLPKSIGPVEVWPAVHGDSILHPDWWKSGRGAWGCYRSHLQILEHCYQKRIESYVVFEDDAIFCDEFDRQLCEFLREVPHDWEQIYLGGQLLHEVQHPPRAVSDHVFIPYNVNRTHCFAVHRRGYEKVYKHLFDQMKPGEHIDHHLGRLHESGRLKLYCPGKWLVGQDGGPSNISGNTNAATFWIDPEKLAVENHEWQQRYIPAIFLEASIEVATELERKGWHRGHWQNADRLDRGLCIALASADVKGGLEGWYKAVMPEAVRERKKCVCLYHPSLVWQMVQQLDCDRFHRVQAANAAEAENQLAEIMAYNASHGCSRIAKPCRNLIYHIWPRNSNGIWQWNVEQLLSRIEQFDGVRSIGVVIDEASDTLAEVKAAFDGIRIDNWIVCPNNSELGEVATFKRLLETLPTDSGFTFYGHAKGVKYDSNQNVKTWASIMYEVCLDNSIYVDASLAQYPVTGPFKNTREYQGQMRYGWHYSGTFFWFHNADVFTRDWQSIPQDYYGTEKWLGGLFRESEAGSLFGGHLGWLYGVGEMARVNRMLSDWRKLALPNRPESIVPVYINARNLLTPLRRMIDYLVQIPNARPIIVDNDSTWPPLLDYYDAECPVEVVRTGINGGKFGWVNHLLDHAAIGVTKYVVTDSDLELAGVPVDVLNVLASGLDENPHITKCGLSLDIESIPDEYSLADEVRTWERQFWQQRRGHFFEAGIDTTFAMRRASDPIARETHGHLRSDKPYTAIHWPWTWSPDAIAASGEIQHYITNCSADGLHWTPRLQSLAVL